MKKILFLILLVLSLVGCSMPEEEPTSVFLEVSGTSSSVTIIYEDSNSGGLIELNNVSLPCELFLKDFEPGQCQYLRLATFNPYVKVVNTSGIYSEISIQVRSYPRPILQSKSGEGVDFTLELEKFTN